MTDEDIMMRVTQFMQYVDGGDYYDYDVGPHWWGTAADFIALARVLMEGWDG